MKKRIPYSVSDGIRSPNDIREVLCEALNDNALNANNKGEQLYSVPCAFDIETSSFYRDTYGRVYTYEEAAACSFTVNGSKLEKCSLCYVWQLGINGRVIVGRSIDEFIEVCSIISEVLQLSEKRRLIVYVHNLSYEFQFIRTLFHWVKVFSTDLRKPIYAISSLGIEFRCSYILSGYSLDRVGKNLHRYKVSKLTGALDYSLIRHSATPLTTEELMYCVNDVRVIMAYIQELLEENGGNITRLPLTNTGFVRRYCRSLCLRKQVNGRKVQNWAYYNLIHRDLLINNVKELDMLQRAFAGGFTHANADKVGDIITGVSSYDFTSAYPYVMVSERFPMSQGVYWKPKSEEHFLRALREYCCLFDVEFTNICPRINTDNPISESKCIVKEGISTNNGRIVTAARIVLTITEVDYAIISQFYQWESKRVGTMIVYRKGYLPTEFVSAILGLYEKKTRLKGVQGSEAEYMHAKEMLNSCYGMCVTNPLRDEFTYREEGGGVWDIQPLTDYEKAEKLEAHNTSLNRFLFYPWGVWVTAYARRNLFTGIVEAGEDYCYSDTDSIKLEHADRHSEYFTRYNSIVERKLQAAARFHGLSFELFAPSTIQGKKKMLGVWDYEGTYKRFKTLGAKRYMTEEETPEGVINSLTVSGVNKKVAIPYLLETYGRAGIFEAFSNYLDIPAGQTGKNLHTYIDYQQEGRVTDYTGRTAEYSTPTGVHLEPTGYTLNLSIIFLDYLRAKKFKS